MAHHLLAIIADQQLDYRAAEQHYLSALQSDAHNPDLLSNMGYSYLLQKRYREGERMLSRSLQVRPNHEKTLNNLGLLYSREGDYQRALATFRRSDSEAEAQWKMAALFPQGSGTPSGLPGALPSNSNVRLASEQRDLNNASSRPLPIEQASSLSGGTSNQTSRLKQMMEKARLESQRQRMQRQLPGFPGDGSSAQATGRPRSIPDSSASRLTPPKSPQEFSRFPSRERRGSRIPQRVPEQIDPRGVADHRINDAFSQIDARRGSRNPGSRYRDQSTNIPPFPTSRDLSQAPMPGSGLPRGTTNRVDQPATIGASPETSRRSHDMPGIWPAPNASPRPIAPASFDVPTTSHPSEALQARPTPSRQAAALAGWNAGPGVLFPVTPSDRAESRPAPAASPTTNRESRLAPIGQPSNSITRSVSPVAPLDQTSSMKALVADPRIGGTAGLPRTSTRRKLSATIGKSAN
jgi:hypothetical protein